MSNTLFNLKEDLKKPSFLVYGLGSTGVSTINYLNKKNFSNFTAWDDNIKVRKKFSSIITRNLKKDILKTDYIIISPGISLEKTKFKKELKKFKNKIITDIDLFFLENKNFKTIVVTGSNGKSTTCKMISHLLKKNKFDVRIGGNIGIPILSLKIRKNTFFVIEASSFQLFHSKFIHPSYAVLLNISNDHIDWHGSMKNYIDSKFKIFRLQKKKDYALINEKLASVYKKKKYSGKLVLTKFKRFDKIVSKIDNDYLKSEANKENLKFTYALAKKIKINDLSFIKAMNTFVGLEHRNEIFLKRKNITFINDSKATSFQAAKNNLKSNKNIYWILGGIPKFKDKFDLKHLKGKIIKSYIIGKNTNYFKNQLRNKINFSITKNLSNSIIKILKEIKLEKKRHFTILLSPCAASFDQFKNFEERGNLFKKLSKKYAKQFI